MSESLLQDRNGEMWHQAGHALHDRWFSPERLEETIHLSRAYRSSGGVNGDALPVEPWQSLVVPPCPELVRFGPLGYQRRPWLPDRDCVQFDSLDSQNVGIAYIFPSTPSTSEGMVRCRAAYFREERNKQSFMAIQFARARYVQRSRGGDAVRQAAYNAREAMQSERTGQQFDWTNKQGTREAHAVLLPPGVKDDRLSDAQVLWNAVEKAEKRRNSVVAREIILALPRGVGQWHRLELVYSFAEEHFVSKGLAVQINIHRPHIGPDGQHENDHAHLLVTTRRLLEDGRTFSPLKARDLDATSRYANGRAFVADGVNWGATWAAHQNRYFGSQGLDITVDPIRPIAEPHLGPGHAHNPTSERSKQHARVRDANRRIMEPVQRKSAAELAEIVGRTVALKLRGKDDWWGLSPFTNEKTPSFHVYAGRNGEGRFHDFSTGEDGDAIKWQMLVEKKTFREAAGETRTIDPEIAKQRDAAERRKQQLAAYRDAHPDLPAEAEAFIDFGAAYRPQPRPVPQKPVEAREVPILREPAPARTARPATADATGAPIPAAREAPTPVARPRRHSPEPVDARESAEPLSPAPQRAPRQAPRRPRERAPPVTPEERAAIEAAAWADRVPSGWRELTVEDVAAQMNPALAAAWKLGAEIRKDIAGKERQRARVAADIAGVPRRVEDRIEEMGGVRRALHKARLHRDLGVEAIERWGRGKRYGYDRLGVKIKALSDKLEAVERTAAADLAKVKPEAEKELSERQQRAAAAQARLAKLKAAERQTARSWRRQRDYKV